jgi:hypothetical protein
LACTQETNRKTIGCHFKKKYIFTDPYVGVPEMRHWVLTGNAKNGIKSGLFATPFLKTEWKRRSL